MNEDCYDVHVLFADIPTHFAVARAKARAEDPADAVGYKRRVPEEVIQHSHHKAAANFMKIKEMEGVNSANLFDTSEGTPSMIYGRSGKNNGIVFHDQKWKEYQTKAEGRSMAEKKDEKPAGHYIGVVDEGFRDQKDLDDLMAVIEKVKKQRLEEEKKQDPEKK